MAMNEYEKEKMTEYLRVMSASDITEWSAMKQRVLDYIKWCWKYEFCGVTLGQLNRRFGTHAVKFGPTVKGIVQTLANGDEIELHRFRSSIIAIDPAFSTFLEPHEDDRHMPMDKAVELIEKKKRQVMERSVINR